MFGLASFAEAYLSFGWNRWVFFGWYIFGAILTAAWIGHGTLHLLIRKAWVRYADIVLIALSLVAAWMMWRIMPDLDVARFDAAQPLSEQYKEIMPAIKEGGWVRLSTPFFNIYGMVTLVGGALYSTYLFWKKRVLPNRALGNILIATGAIVIASASVLTRIGLDNVLYVGELIAAIFMFAGFLVTTKTDRISD